MSLTIAKLNLISISIEIKNKRLFDTQRKLAVCESMFQQNICQEGVAETYLLKAIWEQSQIEIKQEVLDLTPIA